MTEKKKTEKKPKNPNAKAKKSRPWKDRMLAGLSKALKTVTAVENTMPHHTNVGASVATLIGHVSSLAADFTPAKKAKSSKTITIGSIIQLKPEFEAMYSQLGGKRFNGAVVSAEADKQLWIVTLNDGGAVPAIKTLVKKKHVMLAGA